MYAPFCNPYDLLAVLIQAYNQLPGPKSQAISACTDEQYRSLALQLLSGFSRHCIWQPPRGWSSRCIAI